MHEKNNVKGRALLALGLCFGVLILSSVFAVRASLDKIAGAGSAAGEPPSDFGQIQGVDAETPVVDSRDSAAGSGSSGQQGSSADYTVPAEGKIIKYHSMESLVYSRTLDQYMTHQGIDIAADLSSEVMAVADGTVTEVYNDDRYGMTVCISHGNGIVSIYSNLSEHGLAETGDEVTQGQVIGNIGNTAMSEALDESHLHFEITKDENTQDPCEYIEEYKSGN